MSSSQASRFSYAQVLVAALFAVLLTGDAPDSIAFPAPGDGLSRERLYRGFQSRVAKSLGVNRTTVCMVMAGKRTSARVSQAINEEIARIEREIAKSEERAA